MNHALDGRRLSRNVLGELAAVWAGIWDGTPAMQDRNPDMRRLAIAKTADPELAIVELQPHLALLHPQIVASVAAFCHGVADEFAIVVEEPVSGVVHTPGREDERLFVGDGDKDVERDVGGGQHQDRAVEERLAEVERELAQLRRVLRGVGALLDPELLRSSADAATELS